ncbi:MAG: hypothetical protein AB4911_24455 [Oscillochloridaceae bacterium umkhey_bin13]
MPTPPPAALTDLVAREATILVLPAAGASVSLEPRQQRIRLCTKDNVVVYAPMTRPIIHQIGSRLWGRNSPYPVIATQWARQLAHPTTLSDQIARALTRWDLRIRALPTPHGLQCYGLVSDQFRTINQIDLRTAFLAAIHDRDDLATQPQRVEIGRYGDVIEYFSFHSAHARDFQLEYGLSYARNTGYQATHVRYGRRVLVCSNGLTVWFATQAELVHLADHDLDHFITTTVAAGHTHLIDLQTHLVTRQESPIDRMSHDTLLHALPLAPKLRDRLVQQIQIEISRTGANEWSIAQAYTAIATHERHLRPGITSLLTRVGTMVLEQGLAATVQWAEGRGLRADG